MFQSYVFKSIICDVLLEHKFTIMKVVERERDVNHFYWQHVFTTRTGNALFYGLAIVQGCRFALSAQFGLGALEVSPMKALKTGMRSARICL